MPITVARIECFVEFLQRRECARGTIELYRRAVQEFAHWLGPRELSAEGCHQWKTALQSRGLRPATVNTKLVAVNRFLSLAGRPDCQTRLLRLQRRPFRDPDRELTRAEYNRLLRAAQRLHRQRLALLIETMAATGIRVSEVPYITVAALQSRRVDIAMKGKVRTILLPVKLCAKLQRYARGRNIARGPVFCGRRGQPLSRKRIWAEMKALCAAAHVCAHKVFPHNLRHLFATAFYQAFHDIVRLADLLGHSSIDTTRIYLATAGQEHIRQLERLGLVL